MGRLLRPYIPLGVRVPVVCRQLGFAGILIGRQPGERHGAYLARLLPALAAHLGAESAADLQLDHDPALVNRLKDIEEPDGRIVRKVIVVPRGCKVLRYYPSANDPHHLIYRVRAFHDEKTRIRGEHGQLSDLGLARKERRRVKKASKKPPKSYSAPVMHRDGTIIWKRVADAATANKMKRVLQRRLRERRNRAARRR